jgi:hypothetical protein
MSDVKNRKRNKFTCRKSAPRCESACRTSPLKKGDEVNVEPHDHSCQGNVGVVQGSFFALVDQDSPEVGSDVMCTVSTTDGEVSLVKREYLRHRK